VPLDASVTPGFDAAKPPAVLTYSVRFKGANGEAVPGIFVTPGAAAGPKPTVLILHGLGGSKEQMYLAMVSFAGRGFSVFAIDAAGHGKRTPINGKAVALLTLPEMRQVSGQTVADLRRAVDWLETRPEVDKSRIGFLGVSLGGILGGVFAADEPRVKAAVLWAAGGDWGKLVTTSTHPFAQTFRKSGQTDAAKVRAAMADVDPLGTIAAISPRPLLFLNGDKDNVVPVACAEALYAAAREPKERVVLPGGHIPDAIAMLERSARWLGEKLGNPPPSAR
jgi:dienelactone hydrolase